jgi:predicted Fe-Mo cluster-binding NifX family protein
MGDNHGYMLFISHNISHKLHMESLILTTVNDPLFTCKRNKMKIAIPTNDGINVAPCFESAKGCLIVTISLGDIVHEDLRWKSDNIGADTTELCSEVSDCSFVIVHELTQSAKKIFKENRITVIQTADDIITNAIIHYLEHEHLEASNTCCCP